MSDMLISKVVPQDVRVDRIIGTIPEKRIASNAQLNYGYLDTNN